MGIYDRDIEPPLTQEPYVGDDKLPNLKHFQHLQRVWEWVVSGFVIIPCTVGGTTNAIILTPVHRPDRGASGYTAGLTFYFVCDATTDAEGVTIQVQRDATHQLAALPAYIAQPPHAAGINDLRVGTSYLAIYSPAHTPSGLPERFHLK